MVSTTSYLEDRLVFFALQRLLRWFGCCCKILWLQLKQQQSTTGHRSHHCHRC